VGERPLFSICLPVWNGAHLVHIAIEGALSQTEGNWQLIVGDNASSDDLAGVVASYREPRIRYQRWETHVGPEESFNRTMALADGEWILPVGADDRLDPAALQHMAAGIAQAGTSSLPAPIMVVAACRRVFPDGSPADAHYYGPQRPVSPTPGRYDASTWLRVAASGGPFPWNIGSVAFARDALHTTGALRPEIGLAADMELIFRMAAYGDVLYLDEPLLDFTVRAESDGNRRWAADRRSNHEQTPLGLAMLAALATHERQRVVRPEERREIQDAAARLLLRRAAQHRTLTWGRGWLGASADVLRALRLSPGALLNGEAVLLTTGALFAPSWLLRRASAAMRDRTHSSVVTSQLRQDAVAPAPVATDRP
jgi:glycosyltransferase involved in cell wall biosynthesis